MSELRVGPWEMSEHGSSVLDIDFTNWGTTAGTSPAIVEVIDLATGLDVKSVVMPTGSPSMSSGILTMPAITALQDGHEYNIWGTYVDDSSTKDFVVHIRCVSRKKVQ